LCVDALVDALDSTSAISDRGYQNQMVGCGDFRRHRGPHDGKEMPDELNPFWSSSPLVPL